MTEKRTGVVVALNTLFQLLGRGVSSGTTFIIAILLAKQLGPNGFGDLTKITTYVAFFYLIVDLGLNTAFLQEEKEDNRISFQHLLGLRIIISIIAAFVAVGILSLLPQGQQQGYTTTVRIGIILYIASILTQGLITTANVLFQKHLEYKLSTVAIFFGSFATLGLMLLFGSNTVLGGIIILFVGSLITALASLALCKPFEKNLTPLLSLQPSLILLKTALPLSITLVFNLVYFRIDSVILTLARSTAEVGIYNFAYKIFELPLVFPVFFMNALFPIFMKEHKGAPEDFQRHIRLSAAVLFLLSIVTTTGLWFTAPLITNLKAGFTPSIDVVRILSLGIPFFFLSALTMWILITIKKRKALVIIYGISMIINIVANAMFIPSYGYLAAAWITVIGEGIVLLMSTVVILHQGIDKPIKKLTATD